MVLCQFFSGLWAVMADFWLLSLFIWDLVGFFGVCGQLWGVVGDFRFLSGFLVGLWVFLWVTITLFWCKMCGCGW
jgi:hypothetical protein